MKTATLRPIRRLALLPAVVLALGAWPSLADAVPPGPKPVQRSFTMENFRLESGATLPRATIVYGTSGALNAARDNAILLPSHYMATSSGYDWLSGEGHALDTNKYFLIMTEMFGNGRSSSPSNNRPSSGR